MIGIDTCHGLIEERTLQELMHQFRSQVEENIYNQQQQQNINNNENIFNQWKECCNKNILGRHVDELNFDLNINSMVSYNNITIKDYW